MYRCFVCSILLLIAGCVQSDFSADADPDLAEETLVAALDAWKSRDLQFLVRRDPPIRFADDDQRAGCELLEYEVESSHATRFLPFKDVKVMLVLKDRNGKPCRTRWPVTRSP